MRSERNALKGRGELHDQPTPEGARGTARPATTNRHARARRSPHPLGARGTARPATTEPHLRDPAATTLTAPNTSAPPCSRTP
ncbi:hypothetical protein F6Q10_14575 [Streptomyces vinaceus]|nr:hypothetical protein [Streptomyces vinaceus]